MREDILDEQMNPENEESLTIREAITTLRNDVAEIHEILAPMREVIESLPAAMEQVTPLIDGLRNSPVVKMLGIKIP